MAKHWIFGHLSFNWDPYQDNQFYMALQVKYLYNSLFIKYNFGLVSIFMITIWKYFIEGGNL